MSQVAESTYRGHRLDIANRFVEGRREVIERSVQEVFQSSYAQELTDPGHSRRILEAAVTQVKIDLIQVLEKMLAKSIILSQDVQDVHEAFPLSGRLSIEESVGFSTVVKAYCVMSMYFSVTLERLSLDVFSFSMTLNEKEFADTFVETAVYISEALMVDIRQIDTIEEEKATKKTKIQVGEGFYYGTLDLTAALVAKRARKHDDCFTEEGQQIYEAYRNHIFEAPLSEQIMTEKREALLYVLVTQEVKKYASLVLLQLLNKYLIDQEITLEELKASPSFETFRHAVLADFFNEDVTIAVKKYFHEKSVLTLLSDEIFEAALKEEKNFYRPYRRVLAQSFSGAELAAVIIHFHLRQNAREIVWAQSLALFSLFKAKVNAHFGIDD